MYPISGIFLFNRRYLSLILQVYNLLSQVSFSSIAACDSQVYFSYITGIFLFNIRYISLQYQVYFSSTAGIFLFNLRYLFLISQISFSSIVNIFLFYLRCIFLFNRRYITFLLNNHQVSLNRFSIKKSFYLNFRIYGF